MSKTYDTPVVKEYGTVSSRTEQETKIGSEMDSEATASSGVTLSGEIE